MSVGSCVITSYVQGLKDLCNPYNFNYNDEQKLKIFDSLSFMRSSSIEATVSDLLKQTEKGLDMISTLKESDLLQLRQQWIRKSKTFDWSVPGGSIDQYIDLYSRAQEILSPAEKEKYQIFRNQTGMNNGFEAENRFYLDWKSKSSPLDLSNLWPYYTL